MQGLCKTNFAQPLFNPQWVRVLISMNTRTRPKKGLNTEPLL